MERDRVKLKINISIDDVSSRPGSDTSCLKNCWWLIEKYPDIKFTLFVVAAYQRFKDGDTNPSFITDPETSSILRSLPSHNFEIGLHGLSHGQIYPKISNNDEFQDIDYVSALSRMITAEWMMQQVKIPYKKIFRPSAYRMSPPSFMAAQNLGYSLCLKKADYLNEVYRGCDKDYSQNVIYMDISPGHDEFVAGKENLEIVYHALEEDRSYFSKKKAEELDEFLQTVEEDIKFCFIEELAMEGKE